LIGAALADAAPAQKPTSNAGTGLVVMADNSSGFIANGGIATFRVLNASTKNTLNGVRATVDQSKGFSVQSSSCGKSLAPRSSCSIQVSWHGSRADLVDGLLTVSSGAPATSVSSSLRGDGNLSR
jgi:hypothetical protein